MSSVSNHKKRSMRSYRAKAYDRAWFQRDSSAKAQMAKYRKEARKGIINQEVADD